MNSRTITNTHYALLERSMGLMNPHALITGNPLSDVREVDDWWLQAARQLEAIARLPNNWDGEGSLAPSAQIINAASDLLKCLFKTGIIDKPHIYPTRDGGVQFEWERDSKYVEIELVAEGAASFYFCDEAQRLEECGEIFLGERINSLIELILMVTDR